MKGKGFIKLRIIGQDLDFEEITQVLSRQPSFTYKKGDCYTPKYGDKQPIIYKEDCLIFEAEKREDETIDETVLAFLNKFANSKEYLNELSSNADLTLWVSLYPDEEQSNIHLSPDALKLIAVMGISVDFGISFLKEFYDGTYKE